MVVILELRILIATCSIVIMFKRVDHLHADISVNIHRLIVCSSKTVRRHISCHSPDSLITRYELGAVVRLASCKLVHVN